MNKVHSNDHRVSRLPRRTACGSGPGSHLVQFYNDDVGLVDSVTEFVGAALAANEGAMVLATKAHRELFDDRLRAAGIDVDLARVSGRYVSLDAAEVLAQFMIDGRPDRTRFNATVGAATARVVEIAPRVRAFGEMVQLLWSSGNGEAAVAVEKLVGELVETYPLSVQCAYAIDLGKDAARGYFLDVCTAHNGILHSPSYLGSGHPHTADLIVG